MSDTQTIKDRVDIVQLVGEYVKLKKAGVNWRANCPFHHEKTPSFMVHPEKQIWHCFGCGKGGDVFSFIQEVEGLEFVEALKLLANRAGVPLTTYSSEIDTSQRNRLSAILEAAARFFSHVLVALPAGAVARDYLTRQRNLTADTIAEWRVGYAPEQWDLLTKYLLKKGFGINDLVASGLTIQRDGADLATGRGFYDRFRGRIMFAIADQHGAVVGFTGRVLKETPESGGKYVNTPQTKLYDKSRVLYGLDKAKAEIKSQDLTVIVEGQMDVLACHQAGMKNVVAASGTAVTPEQVRLLKRYSANIAMAFDADSAGEKAGERGAGIALQEGARVKVIQLPPGAGKDAAECLETNCAQWFEAVAGAQEVLDWYFKKTLTPALLATPAGQQRAAGILLAEINHLPYAVEREAWLEKLSNRLGVSSTALREELKKIGQRPPVAARAVITPESKGPVSAGPVDIVIQELWSLIIKFPELYSEFQTDLKPGFFTAAPYAALYENAQKLYTISGSLDVAELRQSFVYPNQENIVDVLELWPHKERGALEANLARLEIQALIKRLKDAWLKNRRQQFQQALSESEAAEDYERVASLLKELAALN